MEEENMVQDESSSQEYEGEGQYSEEEVDRIADTAIEAIQDILKYFNVGEVTIEEYEGDEGELILDITGDDLAVLIVATVVRSIRFNSLFRLLRPALLVIAIPSWSTLKAIRLVSVRRSRTLL